MADIVLYDYWRSSASYRVRIALNLLGLSYRPVPIDLLSGAQYSRAHLARNPQGTVPVIEIDGRTLSQSLAIIEYLHETRAGSTLLPETAPDRARARQLAHAIAMEIHPVCNSYVANHVVELTGGGEESRQGWMQTFIGKGLDALEAMVAGEASAFCVGEDPSMADVCLVPQLYNARRWNCPVEGWPRLVAIEARCFELEAFASARPEAVRPAVTG